jgi:hypothetical protein
VGPASPSVIESEKLESKAAVTWIGTLDVMTVCQMLTAAWNAACA